jgi:hypothetical protein
MAEPHPAASHYLPSFITAPGETDVFMVVMGLFLALAVVMFGVLFLRLHSLPDQIAHKSHKLQSEVVCVLCLVALFTHIHIFWIAALLLAMIDLPDFGTSLGRIADSTETMAGRKVRQGGAELPPKTMADVKQADAHEALLEKHGGAMQGNGPVLRRKDAPAPSMGRLFLWRIRSKARGMIAALARWWKRLYSSMADRKVREAGAAEVFDGRRVDAVVLAEYEAASEAPLGVTKTRIDTKAAPYFMEMVRQYVEQRYGSNQLYEGGLKIYTTLDIDLQMAAEEALEKRLTALEAGSVVGRRFSAAWFRWRANLRSSCAVFPSTESNSPPWRWPV